MLLYSTLKLELSNLISTLLSAKSVPTCVFSDQLSPPATVQVPLPLKIELEQIGWTCDYGFNGEVYDVKQIEADDDINWDEILNPTN